MQMTDILNVETPSPYDAMSKDEVLIEWQKLKDHLEDAKKAEMTMRKYIVARAFPTAHEGMNTQELGNGYQLKAGVKFTYSLNNDNKKVEDALDRIAMVGNQGSFIADRLVSWTPNFLLTEYRALQESETNEAKEILKIISEVLIIKDAAPTLEIKEPKKKK
jgi:hypothetical protein